MIARMNRPILAGMAILIGLSVALAGAPASLAQAPADQEFTCPTRSTRRYVQGGVLQYDLDDPVRDTAHNADKNLAYRGIARHPLDATNLVDYGHSSDEKLPPQLATLFRPNRVPRFLTGYRAFDWIWLPSPETGYPSADAQSLPISAIGVITKAGERLATPRQGRSLGKPFGTGAVVLYADEHSITLKFTREDSVAQGYTLHVMGICTDPNLLKLYRKDDNADRYAFGPGSGNTPRDNQVDYVLPGVKHGQPFGVAAGFKIIIAIRDNGSFVDPRSLHDWWRVHPRNRNP